MGVLFTHYIVPEDRTLRPEPADIARLIEALVARGYVPQPDPILIDDPVSEYPWRRDVRYYLGIEALHAQEFEPGLHGAPSTLWQKIAPRLARGASRRRRLYRDRGYPLPFPLPSAGAGILDQPEMEVIWPELRTSQSPFADACASVQWLALRACDDFVDEDGFDSDALRHCACGATLGYSSLGGYEWMRVRRICPACGTAFRPQGDMTQMTYGRSDFPVYIRGGGVYRFCVEIHCGKTGPREKPIVQVVPELLALCRNALGTELQEFSLWR